MTRRIAPQPGVDRMVSPSWSGRRRSSPAARQGRALARGLEGRLPLHSDQNSSSSRCRASFSLALKHGIYFLLRLMQVEKIDWVVDQIQEPRRRGDVTVWAVPVAAEDRIASRKTVNQHQMSRIGMS